MAGGATIALGRFLTSLRSNPGVTDVASLLQSSRPEEPEVAQRRMERLEKVEKWWKKPYTEPQEAGLRLLHSGEFGRISPKERTRNLARILRERALSQRPVPKEDICEVSTYTSLGCRHRSLISCSASYSEFSRLSRGILSGKCILRTVLGR